MGGYFVPLGQPHSSLFCFCHRYSGRGGGGGVVPFFKKLFLQTGRLQQQTEFIHSNDLEACVMKFCCFSFHSVVKFFTLESSL